METLAPIPVSARRPPTIGSEVSPTSVPPVASRRRELADWLRRFWPRREPPVLPPPDARALVQEVQDLQTLHEATLRVARTHDWNQGLREILAAATAAAGTKKGLLSLASPDGTGLRIATAHGFSPEFEASLTFVPSGLGACGAAFARRCRVIVADAKADPLLAGMERLVEIGGFASCHAAPLISREGEVLGVMSAMFDGRHAPTEREIRLMDLYAQMAVDFLERWRAERTQRENERRMQQLFSAMPVAVYMCDVSGRITFHNSAAVDLWGREPKPDDRWCGAFRLLHMDGSPMPHDQCFMARAVGAGQPMAAPEVIIERPDGARRHVMPNLQPIRDTHGHLAGVVNVLVDITARKQFESLLEQSELRCRESEMQLRFVTDVVPVMLMRCDAQERLVFANRAYLEHRARTLDELLGRRLRDVLDSKTYEMLRPYVERVLTGESLKFELELTYPRLGARHVSVAYVPDRSEEGQVRGFVAAITDVTESKHADAMSRQLAAIVASSSDAIVGVNLGGVIESWNRGAETLFGYTASEALGENISFIVPRWREGESNGILARVQEGEHLEHFQTERRRKDGRIVHISLTISPICDAEGRTIGASKIARDVTDLHHAQEAVRQRTRMLEGVNRVSGQLVAELNLTRIVDSVTNAAREVSGAQFAVFFCDETAVGQNSRPTIFSLSGVGAAEFQKFGFSRNSPILEPTFRGERVVRSSDLARDERFRSALAHPEFGLGSYLAVPVTSRDGEVFGALLFGHRETNIFSEETAQIVVAIAAQAAMAIDNAKLYQALERELREKRRTEAELLQAQTQLQAHAALLEQRVQERTQSLREAITQMEEFSYTVSHDLRAPLRAMNTYAQALVEDYGAQLDDTARHYLERIQRSSLRMEKLTHDVLTYSRIGRAEVRLAPVDLDALLRDMIYQYTEFQPPHAEIRVKRPLNDVLGHEVSLGQCIANLLSNAVKFVAPGVRPRIRVHSELTGHVVRLWISDNGIGIDPQYQARLFQVFERLHDRKQYEGTGIGLAIVRKAVEKMGGRCGVESDGTNGSRFWIELPRASAP